MTPRGTVDNPIENARNWQYACETLIVRHNHKRRKRLKINPPRGHYDGRSEPQFNRAEPPSGIAQLVCRLVSAAILMLCAGSILFSAKPVEFEYVGKALQTEGMHVWGSSPVIGPDGKIHFFGAGLIDIDIKGSEALLNAQKNLLQKIQDVSDKKTKVSYFKYDWTLNLQAKPGTTPPKTKIKKAGSNRASLFTCFTTQSSQSGSCSCLTISTQANALALSHRRDELFSEL